MITRRLCISLVILTDVGFFREGGMLSLRVEYTNTVEAPSFQFEVLLLLLGILSG